MCNMCEHTHHISIEEFFTIFSLKSRVSSSLKKKKKRNKEEKFVCRKAVENDLLNCNKSVGTKKQNH